MGDGGSNLAVTKANDRGTEIVETIYFGGLSIVRGKDDEVALFGSEKNHDSHRRDRILRFFLRPEIGQFAPHFGAISLLNYTVSLEKREKHPLEKIQKMQNCR